VNKIKTARLNHNDVINNSSL